MVELRVVDARHSDLHALIKRLDADLLERYPSEEDIFGVDFDAPEVREMTFIVAYDDGEPAGCGGIRPSGGYAELKRLYVGPERRNKGIASRILAALEDKARSLGFRLMRLETGEPQPESIGLYKKYGYYEIEPFGMYVGSASSVCFEKKL